MIVYYDAEKMTLRLAYSSANDVNSLYASNWTIQDIMDTTDTNREFVGKYVSMRINPDNDDYISLSTGTVPAT
jgi:hypothetical protein